MPLPLFATADDADGGPSGLAVLVIIVVVFLVLRYLYSIGFYGKAFKALTKSLGSLVVASVGVVALAAFTDQSRDLDAFANRNGDSLLVFAGLWVLVGLFVFYESVPSAPTAAAKPARPAPKADAKPTAPAATAAASAAPTRCRSCYGRGERIDRCWNCSGNGESRCTARQSGWMGWECRAGVKHYFTSPDRESCDTCNGRGFIRCGICAGRGEVRGTCSDCGGSGAV